MTLITTHEALVAAFAEVDASIAKLKMKPADPMTLVQTPASRLSRAMAIYRLVRPAFSLVSALALVPAPVRSAVQLLIGALDGVAADVASVEFKAGKDL